MLLLLLIKPMLLFDAGFQLSYAAVAGIILWYRPLQQLLPQSSKWFLWLPDRIWQLICVSTSAEIATLPLLLYHFHQFSLYFLIANLTIVPFAGVLLATVLLMLLTGSGWVTSLLSGELVIVDALTRWISSLPHAMLTDIYCDLPVALIITALILVLTLLLYMQKNKEATA
jgi:competence protein ComEC